ncbi:ribonuclease HI [Candidatus Saccharibacteria bacterium]|nr:ribonuclease HI [Candidatus Saccharibacteria bacterium]
MKILWTDGSAEPNPGQGGYAVIEVSSEGARPVVLGGCENTTNIRMEGMALIKAIKYAGDEGCEIHTDSEFWVNVLTKWAPRWRAAGWKKKNGEIKNIEMVQELYELYGLFPVTLVWVKGHDGTLYNEMADKWANKAREGARVDLSVSM